mgnify:CR=1 FL=1
MAGEPAMTAAGAPADRRAAVRAALATGEVSGLRMLAERVEAAGFEVEPDVLRADVRSLSAVRVQRGDTSVLALPMAPEGRGADRTPAPKLTAEISADPDWKLQVGVAAVVIVFLVVAVIGWLIRV